MGSKEIKKLLVDSKEAIIRKDFITALRNCKVVLDADKTNYNAFVFLGAIFQETNEPEKSLSAFRKAIEISPNQTSAWQGLRSFYEKEKPLSHVSDLIDVYKKLIELFSEDKQKQAEIFYSLAVIYHDELCDLSNAVDCALKVIELVTGLSSILEVNCWVNVVMWLSCEPRIEEKNMILLSDGMRTVCQLKSDGRLDELPLNIVDNYFNHLLKSLKYDAVNDEAEKIGRVFPKATVIKWQLLAYISGCLDGFQLQTNNLGTLIDSIHLDNLCIAYARIARGARHYMLNEWIDAKNELLLGLKMVTGGCWQGWLLICRVYQRLHDGNNMEHSAREGLKVIETNFGKYNVRNAEFQLSLAKGVILQNVSDHLSSALPILTKVAEQVEFKMEAFFNKAIVHLKMGSCDEVQEVISMFEACDESYYSSTLRGCLHCHRCEFELAKRQFEISLKFRPGDAFLLFEMGLLCWKAKEFPTAFTFFLKAAKEDSYNFKTFLYIGHYYRDVIGDNRKALRCYRQAFSLESSNDELGIALSDCYRAVGERTANLEFLLSIANKAAVGRCGWVWLRLGVIHLDRDDPELAIQSFQASLRTDPDNRACWECLADAYLMRGSYTSAIKAFNKAIELDPNVLYCQYQVANIKLTLGSFKEAIESFKKILEVMPSYVPALKGLGEAHLCQARQHMEGSLVMEALDCSELALKALARAAVEKPHFSCLWKLIGDVIMAVSCKVTEIKSTIPSSLVESANQNFGEFVVLDAKGLLIVAVRCYSMAARLSRHNSNLWHDIGVANYHLAVLHDPNSEERRLRLSKSLTSFKRAISLNPSQSSHWSALGVAACCNDLKNYAIAQHAFIRAVKAEKNNFVAWTNLGILYLINGNIKLANQAFVVAQSIEPSFINCWIGQALCAENTGHEDTLDLFRHCTNLGYHPESCLGFASWVCNILLDPNIHLIEAHRYVIEELDAISVATDAMYHYTNLVKDDPCAFNILGLLLERQGLNRESKRAFLKALHLLSSNPDTENLEQLNSFVHCNLARVYRHLGLYEDATFEASAVTLPDLYNTYCKAVAYYETGDIEKSDEAYNEALQKMAVTDEEKSHLTMAMASVIYKLQGSEAAKTPLYESFQYRPPCVQGLLALAAVGLLESDGDLSIAAVHELEQLDPDPRFMAKINHVRSRLFIAQSRIVEARNVFCKAVHQWPADWLHWKDMGVYFMTCGSEDLLHKVKAVDFFTTAQSLRTTPSIEILQWYCVCLISSGRFKQGLSSAKKLVHLFPDDPCNWDILEFLNTTIRING